MHKREKTNTILILKGMIREPLGINLYTLSRRIESKNHINFQHNY